MTMDGCEQCSADWTAGRTYANCDLLTVYSQMCYQVWLHVMCDGHLHFSIRQWLV